MPPGQPCQLRCHSLSVGQGVQIGAATLILRIAPGFDRGVLRVFQRPVGSGTLTPCSVSAVLAAGKTGAGGGLPGLLLQRTGSGRKRRAR
jgi:hypothetical protein